MKNEKTFFFLCATTYLANINKPANDTRNIYGKNSDKYQKASLENSNCNKKVMALAEMMKGKIF